MYIFAIVYCCVNSTAPGIKLFPETAKDFIYKSNIKHRLIQNSGSYKGNSLIVKLVPRELVLVNWELLKHILGIFVSEKVQKNGNFRVK